MTARRLTSIRLVAGASDQAGWTLTEADGRALFRVGSAEECNWRVNADGVAPHQFMLMWNGAELTVIDVGGGEVRIDGRALEGTAIVRSGRIEFGDAAMEIKSAGGAGVVFGGLAETAASLKGPTWAPSAPRTSAPASMSDVLTLASTTRRRGGSHPHVIAAGATEVMDVPSVPRETASHRSADNAHTTAQRRSGATMTLPSDERFAEASPAGGRSLPPGVYASTAPLGSRCADGQGVAVPSLTIGRRAPGRIASPLQATRAPADTPPCLLSQSQPNASLSRASGASRLPLPSAGSLPLPPPSSAPLSPVPATGAPQEPRSVADTRAAAPASPTVSHRPAAGKTRQSRPSPALQATRVPEPVRGPEPPPAPALNERRVPPRTWALVAATAATGIGLVLLQGRAPSAAAADAGPATGTSRSAPVAETAEPAPGGTPADTAPAASATGAPADSADPAARPTGAPADSAAPAASATESPADSADLAARATGSSADSAGSAAPARSPAGSAAPVASATRPSDGGVAPAALPPVEQPAAASADQTSRASARDGAAASTGALAAPGAPLDLIDDSDPLATAHCGDSRRRRRRCEALTRERVAADLVVQGRRAEAAERYRRLAADTGDGRFAVFAEILSTATCPDEDCR